MKDVFLTKGEDTVIVMIRHTEPEWPYPEVNYSDEKFGFDVPGLSERGKKMAENIGRQLKEAGVSIDAVYTSPYRRTRQTAVRILNGGGYEVEPEPDYRLGETEGTGIASSGLNVSSLRWPGEPLDQTKGERIGDMHDPSIMEEYGYTMETPSETAWRVNEVIGEVCRNNPGRTVLMVTHGEPANYGTHLREIGHGPMPLTYEMERGGRRYRQGSGMVMRIAPDGTMKELHRLIFGKEGNELCIEGVSDMDGSPRKELRIAKESK